MHITNSSCANIPLQQVQLHHSPSFFFAFPCQHIWLMQAFVASPDFKAVTPSHIAHKRSRTDSLRLKSEVLIEFSRKQRKWKLYCHGRSEWMLHHHLKNEHRAKTVKIVSSFLLIQSKMGLKSRILPISWKAIIILIKLNCKILEDSYSYDSMLSVVSVYEPEKSLHQAKEKTTRVKIWIVSRVLFICLPTSQDFKLSQNSEKHDISTFSCSNFVLFSSVVPREVKHSPKIQRFSVNKSLLKL